MWLHIHALISMVVSKGMDEYNYIPLKTIYHETSNISRTLVDNKILDHSDVVGASPVGAAPTTS